MNELASTMKELILAKLAGAVPHRGVSELSRITGLERSSLYKALGERGNPSLDTLVRISIGLGFKVTLEKLTGKV